jgi:voltage-gated sodium channel type IV alpha
MRLWVVAGLTILAGVAFFGVADAAAGHPSTCAEVTVQAVPSTLGSRYWFIVDATQSSPTTISGCQGAAQALRERAPPDSITLKCIETTTGVSPPLAPSTVTIYAQSDNANSGSPATSPIWSTAFTGSCTGASTATFFCTSNGLVGGTPRLGLVRFIVRAVKTGGGSYDVNSDTGSGGAGFTEGSGVMRCQADATAFTDSNPPFGAQGTYIGGQVFRSVLTAQVDYAPANMGDMFIGCSGTAHDVGAASFSTGTVTLDVTLQGTTSSWPNNCVLTQNETFTRASAITSFTPAGTVLYATWNTSPCGSCGTVINVGGVTAALNRSTVNLNRTLFTGDGNVGNNDPCVMNNLSRGDAVSFSCSWRNAIGHVNGGDDFRGYATSDGFRDEAAFVHGDGTFSNAGTGGIATWSSTASTSAPVGSPYHQQVDEFATGHVGDDSFLFNWGNSSNSFNVTSNGTFDGINISKTSGGTNVSSFTIGNDIEYATAKGLRNASGSLIASVSVSCQRTRPDFTTEPSVVMGNTDGSGNSPEKQFSVVAPAGTWQMTCSAAWSGNNATYTIAFFHVSPFTGNLQAPILWNVSPQTNGTALVNITTCLREYDQVSDAVMRVAPDDVVKLTVEAYNASDDLHDIKLQNRTVMGHEDGGVATCFRSNFYTNQSNLVGGAFAYVTMNFTGNAFMGSEAFIQMKSFTGNFSGNFTGNSTGNFSGNVSGSGPWCLPGSDPSACVGNGYANQTFLPIGPYVQWSDGNLTYCKLGACVNSTYANQTFLPIGPYVQWSDGNATYCRLGACVNSTYANQTFLPIGPYVQWSEGNLTYCKLGTCVNSTYANQTFLPIGPYIQWADGNATYCSQGGPCTGNFSGNTSGNFSGNFSGNSTGNFTGNFTILGFVNGMIGLDFTSPFYGDLSIAGVLVMILWFFAFLWAAKREYYFLAVFAWLGILQPLYVSGFGITFTAILSIWILVLMLQVVQEWRDAKMAKSRRPGRGDGS